MTVSINGTDYATIQAAVDAAANGDTIEITAGTYTEDVTITGKSITIDGAETGGVNDVTLNGQITVAGTLNGALAITDLNINATGKSYGVFVSANSSGFAGSVTLDDVAIANARSNGFAYIRAGNGSVPTLGDTIGAGSPRLGRRVAFRVRLRPWRYAAGWQGSNRRRDRSPRE